MNFVHALVAVVLFIVPAAANGQQADTASQASVDLPGATLADDLKTIEVPLAEGYAAKRPRLLFGPDDREALKKKAEAAPKMWQAVLDSANRYVEPPSPDAIAKGERYWRIEHVQSAALAYFVTGAKPHLDTASRWMVAYSKVPLWGDGDWRPNIDLYAAWDLYHIAIAYDILHADLADADRQAIRDGLAAHAKAIYESFDPNSKEPYRWDQNHTYIPAVALATGSLVLLGEVPEANEWLKRAYAVMRRCRYALGEDGYYYEGVGYWTYALHWHARYADVMSRATGRNLWDLPALRENWRYALHLMLPGPPGAFDMNDMGRWSGTARPAVTINNYGFLWKVASYAASLAADRLAERQKDDDYPAAAFLWYRLNTVGDFGFPADPRPYEHFKDHGVVVWRSGWGPDDTVYAFRCGPPAGHAATAKLARMKDWLPNCGHVHADIGGFWMYARGAYLATDTGYTAEKWTRDQNTILVDGKGQAADGSYWNDRGFPYEKLNQARIDAVRLTWGYGFVSGEYGAVYDRVAPGLKLRRTLLMLDGCLLVVDDMADTKDHKLTWICHADAEFKAVGQNFESRPGKARLVVIPLGYDPYDAVLDKTTVVAGDSPNKGTPTQRGFQITLTMQKAAKTARLVNLLVPLAAEGQPPRIGDFKSEADRLTLELLWPSGNRETIKVNLAWRTGDPGEPIEIATQPREQK